MAASSLVYYATKTQVPLVAAPPLRVGEYVRVLHYAGAPDKRVCSKRKYREVNQRTSSAPSSSLDTLTSRSLVRSIVVGANSIIVAWPKECDW